MMLAACPEKNISEIMRKNGVTDLFPRDCAMYAAKNRLFPEEDGVQNAQSEHWLGKERKERKKESASKPNGANAESD